MNPLRNARLRFSFLVHSALNGDQSMTEPEAKAEYVSQLFQLQTIDNSPEQILETATALARWYVSLGHGTTICQRASEIRNHGFKVRTQRTLLANAYLNLTEEYIKCSR